MSRLISSLLTLARANTDVGRYGSWEKRSRHPQGLLPQSLQRSNDGVARGRASPSDRRPVLSSASPATTPTFSDAHSWGRSRGPRSRSSNVSCRPPSAIGFTVADIREIRPNHHDVHIVPTPARPEGPRLDRAPRRRARTYWIRSHDPASTLTSSIDARAASECPQDSDAFSRACCVARAEREHDAIRYGSYALSAWGRASARQALLLAPHRAPLSPGGLFSRAL